MSARRANIDTLGAGLFGALLGFVWCTVLCPALAVLIPYALGGGQ